MVYIETTNLLSCDRYLPLLSAKALLSLFWEPTFSSIYITITTSVHKLSMVFLLNSTNKH